MTRLRLLAVTLAIPAVAASVLLYWYQWGASALLPSEVIEYMAKIEVQAQKPMIDLVTS